MDLAEPSSIVAVQLLVDSSLPVSNPDFLTLAKTDMCLSESLIMHQQISGGVRVCTPPFLVELKALECKRADVLNNVFLSCSIKTIRGHASSQLPFEILHSLPGAPHSDRTSEANNRFPPPDVIGNIFSQNASTKSCLMSVCTRFALP